MSRADVAVEQVGRLEGRLFQTSGSDALLVLAALLHAALLAACARRVTIGPGAIAFASLVAVGIWWGSNTVSHIHLHRPLFRWRWLNRGFSLFLTLLLGVPQSIWRERHLWHHAGEPDRGPLRGPREAQPIVELALIGLSWVALAAALRPSFLLVYLPGYAAGLALCQAQGHFEHAGAGLGGISCYGRLHNLLWFNDGYHAEHHRHPGEHWTRLPARRLVDAPVSRWPPVLRFLARLPVLGERAQSRLLGGLEELALASPAIGRMMVRVHARAFRALLLGPDGPPPDRIRRACVVGGGLFPRTAMVLAELLPGCRITLLDASAAHLERARTYLADHGHDLARFDLVRAELDPARLDGFDLAVLPLAFVGDREAIYRRGGDGPPALLIHDWIRRRRGRGGVVIAWFLLKRLNRA